MGIKVQVRQETREDKDDQGDIAPEQSAVDLGGRNRFRIRLPFIHHGGTRVDIEGAVGEAIKVE